MENKLKWVVSAELAGDYAMIMTFNDGCKKMFDFEQVIKNQDVFKPLFEKSVFENFKIDGWTLSWLDGKIDIAPEFLYEQGVPCDDGRIYSQAAERQEHYGNK